MNHLFTEISEYINNNKDQIVQDLGTFVDLEGHFNEKENVLKSQQWFREQMEAEGFECSYKEVAEDKAGIVVGILGKDRPGEPVIFSGHCDTVHYTGSFERKFYVENGNAYGPGVLDMKGGLIIALYAVKALNAIGFKDRPIKMIIVGEEESDHVGNEADKLITEESRGACCAFNMECGELENRICTSRKSQYTYYLNVDGVGGHAGNDFVRGRNAIHEASHKIQEIIKLTDLERGTTVTTAVIKGGGHSSGIPDRCEVIFDVRVNSEDEAQRILDSIHSIAATTWIEGTTTTLDFYRARLAPLQEDEGVLQFLSFVNSVAESSGHKAFGKLHRGGATDAGNIAAAGVPVLCACGIRGDFAHNKKEYGVVESLFDRATIFANTVTQLNELYPVR